jgi:hypothetical protein
MEPFLSPGHTTALASNRSDRLALRRRNHLSGLVFDILRTVSFGSNRLKTVGSFSLCILPLPPREDPLIVDKRLSLAVLHHQSDNFR